MLHYSNKVSNLNVINDLEVAIIGGLCDMLKVLPTAVWSSLWVVESVALVKRFL